MKGMKKLLSILMVLTLVLSLGAIAFAAEGGKTGTVTVADKPANDQVEHTYKLYQIFSGTQDDTTTEKAPLGDIAWGSGIDSTGLLKELAADPTFSALDITESSTAAEVAKVLNDSNAQQFAKIAAEHVTTATETVDTKDKKTANVPVGYYLIVDETKTLDGQTARNETMLDVTGNVTISNKYDVPTSDKFVKDINDSSDGDISNNAWEKSADHDIGDKVPFQLKATIPAGTTEYYDTYKLIFHDKEEPGLAFQNDAKAYLNDVEIPAGKYTVTTSTDDNCTFEVSFDNIKSLDDFNAGAENVITIEYTSELTEGCVIGNSGNHNEMKLEFSNKSSSEGTGETPWKKVVVFTYDMDVNKVDGENRPLPGAEFKLYKKVPAETVGAVQLNKKTGAIAKPGEETLDGVYLACDNDLKVDANDATLFTAEGLDDGDYVIVETKTPAGYNTAAPIEFTLEATHDATDGNCMTKVTTPTDFSVDMTRTDRAILSTDVKNFEGATLPETGGIGTTIFYIAGAILVAGAVILLVTKKRVSGMEK